MSPLSFSAPISAMLAYIAIHQALFGPNFSLEEEHFLVVLLALHTTIGDQFFSVSPLPPSGFHVPDFLAA